MARRSLAGLLVMLAAASCLVTSTPDLTPAPQQPPYLLVGGAVPDPRAPVVIASEQMSQATFFSATVVAADPNVDLNAELLIDYGTDRADGLKAGDRVRKSVPKTGGVIRPVSLPWYPSITSSIKPGCHTVTLIVTHDFDNDTGCPMRLCDSSQLTWLVNLALDQGAGCKASDYPTPTDTCPLDNLPPTATAEEHAKLRLQYPCPGDDADAGAP